MDVERELFQERERMGLIWIARIMYMPLRMRLRFGSSIKGGGIGSFSGRIVVGAFCYYVGFIVSK